MVSLWQELEPYVSAFSATLPLRHQHGDTVTVGGEVTGILNMMNIMQDAYEEDFRTDGVYVTLDDGIGESYLCVAPTAFQTYEEKHGELKIGQVVLVEGKLHRLDTTHSYKNAKGKKVTIDKHPDDALRVLVYQMAPLPKKTKKKIVKPKAE